MVRTRTVQGRAIATAAIDALIAAGRPTEAESFLASAPYIDTERSKLANAYVGAGLTDKALNLVKAMPESQRTGFLTLAIHTADKAGRPEVVAALLASLPDDAARQAVRQT